MLFVYNLTGQIKVLQADLSVERPQSRVILGGNAVDIPTTLGQESLPSQGGTSVTLSDTVFVLVLL